MNLSERKPIWIELSNLYLDTELQDYTLRHIAVKFKESNYTLEEIKQIDKEEVFPILYSNLLGIGGVWGGFQEERLISEITDKLRKRSRLKCFFNKIGYAICKGIYAANWEKIELEYHKR